jgi:predicted transcriptional regulator
LILEDSYLSRFAARWPEEVAQRGFVPVPKCLITCADDLDLKPQEAIVLYNIIEKCWKAGDKAWPSVDYIAKNIGRSNSSTREILKSLSDKRFITKEQRFNTTNLYGLEPTAQKLAKHMKDCRHTVRKQEGYRQKSSSRDSQKTSDYIETELIRNTEVETYSQHVNSNDTDETSYSFIEDSTRNKSKHPCMTSKGIKHDWDEGFKTIKPVNKNGEEVIWEYHACNRCGDKNHTKVPFDEKIRYDLYH